MEVANDEETVRSCDDAVRLLADTLAQPTDAAVGTWKLNVAKSKYSPGPAPQSQTLKIEAWDDGLKLTSDGVDAKGEKTHAEYAAKFDGKDYSFTGNPNADTVVLKRIDSHTIESQWKNGKPTITVRTTIAEDGKTRTSRQTGKNAQGLDINHVLIFEKQ